MWFRKPQWAAHLPETGRTMDISSLTKLTSNPQVRQLVMSLLGQLGGKAGGGANMAGLMQNLGSNGLGEQVRSWVSTGDNQPITPDQITKAIGPEQLHRAAESAGMSDKQAADSLAKVLPQMVDQASPSGQPPQAADFEQLFNRLFSGQPQPAGAGQGSAQRKASTPGRAPRK